MYSCHIVQKHKSDKYIIYLLQHNSRIGIICLADGLKKKKFIIEIFIIVSKNSLVCIYTHCHVTLQSL